MKPEATMHENARELLEHKSEENLRRLEDQIQRLKIMAVHASTGMRTHSYDFIQDFADRRMVIQMKLGELKQADAEAWESLYSALNDAFNELGEGIARARFLMS